jgi:hypothetical protein
MRLSVHLLVIAAGAALATTASAVPAFPGAEGFGSDTPGGRGSSSPPYTYTVKEVWSLQDGLPAPPWSLRAAIDAPGPRIIVFRVAGTIELVAPLQILHPYVTIAGQTAPAPGITLRQLSLIPEASTHALEIRTHDVVVRGLRVRPGRATFGAGPLPGAKQDAIHVSKLLDVAGRPDVHHVVIDHVTASWATDENIDVGVATDVTIQWSLLSEPLYWDPTTWTGDPLAPGDLTAGAGYNLLISQPADVVTGRVSVHHNLTAHAHERAPSSSTFGLVDVLNNLNADYARYGTVIDDCQWAPGGSFACVAIPPGFAPPPQAPLPRIPMNYGYNFFKRGPATTSLTEMYVRHRIGDPSDPRPSFALWVRGNLTPHRELLTGTPDADQIGEMIACATGTQQQGSGGTPVACSATDYFVASPHPTGPAFVRAEPLTPTLLQRLRAEAGASFRVAETGEIVAARDAIDVRVASEVGNLDALAPDDATGAGGGIVTAPSAGWPGGVQYVALATFDVDQDGMPGAWESAHGFDPLVRDDNLDADWDGYTNLEEYLNGTDPWDWDNDGVPAAQDDCPYVANASQLDSDGDGFGNACDNCMFTANGGLAPLAQRDTNGDGYGNVCDPDLDGDRDVDGPDVLAMLALVGQTSNPSFPHADLDGSGAIDGGDVAIYSAFFAYYPVNGAGRPGPSAFVDSDADGLVDGQDDCIFDANGPAALDAGGLSQRDVDGDGFGNACDPDVGPIAPGDGLVDDADVAALIVLTGLPKDDSNRQRGDLDANDKVELPDFAVLNTFYSRTPAKPGPSAFVTPHP